MQNITTCLWFDTQAEEAVNFYTSTFKNSKVGTTMRYDAASAKASGQPEGSILTIEFEINGMQFLALNGGPVFQFTPAVSFVVNCDSQEEIDRLWDALSADPASEQCGWLKDKFGVSWQIVPANVAELVSNPNGMAAMIQMKKLDIAELEKARDQA